MNSAPHSDRRARARHWLGVILLLVAGGAWPAEPIVIMISFDGFRHDYIDRFETPNFDRVAREGVRADGLIPVFPSKTFPNHLSIATGVRPATHGIIDNNFYAPDRDAVYSMNDRDAVEDGSWYLAEPIWVTAQRQGLPTAAFFWVGTEAPIAGVQPGEWRSYDQDTPNELRVRTVLEWLDRPEPDRPRLIMLYFSDVDTAGHEFGPLAPQTRAAVVEVDRLLGRLLDTVAARPALVDSVHFVLVSDHGMTDNRAVTELPPPPVVPRAQFGRGAFVSLWFDDPAQAGHYAASIRQTSPGLLPLVTGHYPAWTCLAGSPRAPHLLVLAQPGTAVYAHGGEPPHDPGLHGYRPDHPDMHGIFLAMGPQLVEGERIKVFENIHINPLVAALLGIRPHPDIDGRLEVLEPILRDR